MANERINEGPSPAEIKELNEKTGGEKLSKNKKIAVGVVTGVVTLAGSFSGTPGTEVSTSADGNQLNKNPNQIVENMPGGFPSRQALKDFLGKNNLEIESIGDVFGIESAEAATGDKLTLKIGSKEYFLNGKRMLMDVAPFINKDDRTMVPIRFVAEVLGYQVDYKNRVVTIKGDDIAIMMTIGSKLFTVNGQTHQMDTVATIINSRTFVPVRFVAEALKNKVDYIAGGTINITSENVVTNETENQSPEYKARKTLYDEMQKVIIGKPGWTGTINSDYLGIHTTYSGVNVLQLDKSDVENYLKTGTATGFEAIKDSDGMDVAIKMKNEFGFGNNEKTFEEAINWLRTNDPERFNRVIRSGKFFGSNWGKYGVVETTGSGTWSIIFGSSIVAIESNNEKNWDHNLSVFFTEAIAIEKSKLGWSTKNGGIEKGKQLIVAAQDWLDRGLISQNQFRYFESFANMVINYYEKT